MEETLEAVLVLVESLVEEEAMVAAEVVSEVVTVDIKELKVTVVTVLVVMVTVVEEAMAVDRIWRLTWWRRRGGYDGYNEGGNCGGGNWGGGRDCNDFGN